MTYADKGKRSETQDNKYDTEETILQIEKYNARRAALGC